jgi:hypothetical protein
MLCPCSESTDSPVLEFIKHPLTPSNPSILGGLKYSSPFQWLWAEYKILSAFGILFLLSSLGFNAFFVYTYLIKNDERKHRRVILQPTNQPMI